MECMEKGIIITGANRGIGKGVLEHFSRRGYRVCACARSIDDSFLSEIEQLKEDTKMEIIPIEFDLRDEMSVKKGMHEILSSQKDIDVLVNNAGVPHAGTLMTTSMSAMKEVYQINVLAQMQIMQLVSRKMIRQKKGCIINMCSVGGIEAMPGYMAYGSSKAALSWITKAAARELGTYGVRVNGLAPGLIDTNMGHYKSEDEVSKVLNRMSIKRMGTVDEVVKAIQYIAEDATYMTGQIMVLDGGRINV